MTNRLFVNNCANIEYSFTLRTEINLQALIKQSLVNICEQELNQITNALNNKDYIFYILF